MSRLPVKFSRLKAAALLLMVTSALALSIPVFGEKKPQSLLPPGFGSTPADTQSSDQRPVAEPNEQKSPDLIDDLKLNTPDQNATSAAKKHQTKSSAASVDALGLSGTGSDALSNAVSAADSGTAEPTPVYDLPPEARHSLSQIGILSPQSQGLGANAFGAVDGRLLENVMRQTTAPVASRWVSIVLRRALLSDVLTPSNVNGADWVAERAWMLLRMGEADSARMLIQRIDHDDYTPKLYGVAMQSALANADMASFCPIVPQASKVSDDAAWPFARAICASLSGESGSASSYLREAQSDTGVRGFDSRLAERVIGAGKNTRHAVVIEWNDVFRLSAWRFGMATAVGIPIPNKLYTTVRPNVRAWAARAAMLKLSDRMDAVDSAAALGVFSSEAMVDYYAALADQGDISRNDTSPQSLLLKAYAGDSVATRAQAMQSLWTPQNADALHQYARLVLTAHAAAQLPADQSLAKYCDAFTASMFTAGLDTQAQRWAKIASEGSDDAARRAWGLLAVGAPTAIVDISDRRINAYRSTGDLRSHFLVAALAGLGRIAPGDAGRMANEFNINIGQKTSWTRAIEAAAGRHEAGTVAVLAATGMQTTSWSNVSPENLFHIISALKQVGLEPEARMVAAEALTRA